MAFTSISDLYKSFLECTSICTDSRAIQPGCMFWALKGPNFDGNKFAEQALNSGAKYAVVDDSVNPNRPEILKVENSLTALQELARYHRSQFEIPIIAITGSNGKTTTKELSALVLSQSYRCHFTQGNLNNHIGVPLTLLSMPQDTEVGIIEMGANHLGEIELLCSIVKPTHGLVTNIGKAHLEGFGGLEGVKKGKGELFDYLALNNGVAFVNKDEAYLDNLSADLGHKRVFYGLKDSSEESSWLRVEPIESPENFLSVKFWSGSGQEEVANTQLIGDFNIPNLATAISLGLYFKVPPMDIVNGVEQYNPKSNRSQFLKFKGGMIVLDAYNANPTSMILALQYFAKIKEKGKMVILGSMKELGDFSEEEHSKILSMARAMNFERIILVGREFKQAALQYNCDYYNDVDDLKKELAEDFFNNKFILLKGSRSVHLEKLLS